MSPRLRDRMPPDLDESPAPVATAARPWTVSTAALIGYALAASFLARGAQNPSQTSGNGANGIAFVVLGTLVLALTTFTLQGHRVARACLLLPLVVGSVVVLLDENQPVWLRAATGAAAVAAMALFLLEPHSRRYFGDDATPLTLAALDPPPAETERFDL